MFKVPLSSAQGAGNQTNESSTSEHQKLSPLVLCGTCRVKQRLQSGFTLKLRNRLVWVRRVIKRLLDIH